MVQYRFDFECFCSLFKLNALVTTIAVLFDIQLTFHYNSGRGLRFLTQQIHGFDPRSWSLMIPRLWERYGTHFTKIQM